MLSVLWSSQASPCLLSFLMASMRAESSRVNQILNLEAAPVGQNFITPQNIFSRLRARFQIGLDPDELLRTLTIGHVGKSSTCRAKNPGQAISPRCSLSILPSYLVWKAAVPWRTSNFRWHPRNGLSAVLVKTPRCAFSLNHSSPQ